MVKEDHNQLVVHDDSDKGRDNYVPTLRKDFTDQGFKVNGEGVRCSLEQKPQRKLMEKPRYFLHCFLN